MKQASDGVVEGRFLMGLTNQPITAMLPVAHAWLQPPDVKLVGEDFADEGYSRNNRAYHLRRQSKGNTKLQFNIQASEKSPVVNPAFVIAGWGKGSASLKLNGKAIAIGKDFRIGHIDRLEGSSLVVWIRAQLTGPSSISLTPASGSH